ncbi:MAG TPA: nucleotidyltransferase domain-containing protein [Polyangia bacterium]
MERIIFYGSHVRGAASPASDWDFIVVLQDGSANMEAQETLLRSAAIGSEVANDALRVDVWPIAKSEWECARKLHGHPIRTAEQEGVVLHGA